MAKGLKIQLPSAVTDATGLKKLEHYYGIEFTRGTTNGGAKGEYNKMIGDETLLSEMRFHNQIQIASVKGGSVQSVLNQTNWRQTASGDTSVIDGSDGSDIMQVHTKGVYAILGGTNETYERFIVSDQPFSYDGDEAVYYAAYGETPDYEVIVNSEARSIRDDSVIGTHGVGSATFTSSSDYGADSTGAGYPTASTSRYGYEKSAMLKNSDTTLKRPYFNITNFDIELTAAFMFIEFRSKLLNSYLGHGISSNAAPTADTWGKVTGFRFTKDGGSTYTYGTFGTYVTLPGATSTTHMWNVLNGTAPVTKMFEAQLAVSDGGTLESVTASDGTAVEGVDDGVMTGIYTKTFSFTLDCQMSDDTESNTYAVDCVLRIPVWRGRTRLWGNLLQWYSGYEATVMQDSSDSSYIYNFYRAATLDDIVTDSDEVAKSTSEYFSFETAYANIGTHVNSVSEWGFWGVSTHTVSGISTAIAATSGGSMFSGEQAYVYHGNAPALQDTKYRRGASLGENASHGIAVLRNVLVGDAPSGSLSTRGGGFRVELTD